MYKTSVPFLKLMGFTSFGSGDTYYNQYPIEEIKQLILDIDFSY